jgi:hypothetical protein
MLPTPVIVADPPNTPAPQGQLVAGAFWPVIDLAALRFAVAVDSSVTIQRLEEAATEAMAAVIDQLTPWAAAHEAVGIASLAAVPALAINGTSVHVSRFKRAIYAYTKANLAERYADSDATGRAERGEEGRRTQADEYRRDGLHAVRDILGVARMTSELI